MIRGIGITSGSSSSGGGSSSANQGVDTSNPTAGQTKITVSSFSLNEYVVFIDGTMQTYGYTKTASNELTFDTAFEGGEEVTVVGIK